MPKILVTIISFLFIASLATYNTYALVATPYIAIGLVKLISLMITALSVPVTFIVHLYRKKNLGVSILISLLILALLGIVVGYILYFLGYASFRMDIR